MNLERIQDKLDRGKKLRILFLNDVGFQYGAGIAQLRQIQSFLLLGHEVMGLCWRRGAEADIPFFGQNGDGLWLGLRELTKIHYSEGYGKNELIDALVNEVKRAAPDVVIVGNLHGAMWPLETLLHLRDLNLLVVAYMHDCFLITGRCCYPGECRMYESGCDETCPTAREHPQLPPSQIRDAWKLRRAIFCGRDGIPLATNSNWTLNLAKRSFAELQCAGVVYLGLDEQLFKPIDRSLARRLLGIPEHQPVVLSGAVNLNDKRKGWDIFKKVVSNLQEDLHFLIFGENSLKEKSVYGVGLLRDYRKMPILYSAADIFVATSLEEAFGQTVVEASSCALPVVAFNVGGFQEIARHGTNAMLAGERNVESLLEAIRSLLNNPAKREALGKTGREIVKKEFSLEKQGERWMEFIKKAVFN
ncbi:MAG: glycosyltransferase [Deltaproteobacteria bacterium]|nr:glycosyltransferase [Deltaproteobacteria bacterium]